MGAFWLQKLAAERDGLQRELEELKKKFEGVRSRNKVLSSEVKTLRSQLGTLVEKGRHDDELIDALMVRPPPNPVIRPRPRPLPALPRPHPYATCVSRQQPTASRRPPRGRSSSEAAQGRTEVTVSETDVRHQPPGLWRPREKEMGGGGGPGGRLGWFFIGEWGASGGASTNSCLGGNTQPLPSGPLGSSL